jgi:cystathionine beta-lyase
MSEVADFDVTDDELRATGVIKWNYAPPDVLPAWIAEMDVRPCPPVRAAVAEAVARGEFGYPPLDARTGLPEIVAAYQAEHFGWPADPATVVLTSDVMAGVRLVLEHLCEPAPVVVPVPAYPPFLDIVPLSGRELVTVPCVEDGDGAGGRMVLDLDATAAALAAGARTVLISAPHNPLGRAFDPKELLALRDVVERHGARVISDEIHGQLALPGATHTPYLSLDGTAGHATAVLSASKAWNLAGLRCAQIVTGTVADAQRLRSLPPVANDSVSPLGVAASVAAYTRGEPWRESLLRQLAQRRDEFGALVARLLPQLHWTPMEATYLAWLDARAYGHDDPAAVALERGRVRLGPGHDYQPGLPGHARLNLATSPERLTEIVRRLAHAWT